VLTAATGQVQIDGPRDRDGSFEPQIVKKRQRRLNRGDEIVRSLYANGLTGRGLGQVREDLRRVGVEGDDLADSRRGNSGDERWCNWPLEVSTLR
jgi:transposase-like protein